MPPVHKLLVANRAEIAARVLATARRMGIATVAVFSDPDAELPYVGMADEAVHLPGSVPSDTYLSIEAMLAAARRTGADAVHPGYGFLSERAAFAAACRDAGLTFVGPSPAAIEAMGSKTAAKDLMARAGVPVLPGHTVGPDDDVAGAAASVGYPLLVKAALGGGGRGMRRVEEPSALEAAVASAQREAAAAFGDGTVFLERYVERPRHVEVQVLGDATGHVVALYERECSIQRRYQKVIEEAPSPAVDQALRRALGDAAVAAAEAIGYTGAGTVEFVVGPDGSFYFLEVNTRLQVEHPVTEMVTGLDLVELQLRVAGGEPLPEAVTTAALTGHAIEARLYAEDVTRDFLPTGGTLHRLAFPEGPHLRVDAGYGDGSVVSTYYDAMLAKVVAWAPDRVAAARRLADALAATQVHGVVSNRDLLVGVLRHPEFVAGTVDTGFLERHGPDELLASTRAARPVHAVAAALAASAARRAGQAVQRSVRPGWRNVPTALQEVVLRDAEGAARVGYRWGRTPREVEVQVDGCPVEIELWRCGPAEVDLSVGGVRRRCAVQWVGGTAYVDSPMGSSVLAEEPRFVEPTAPAVAGSLVAPLPGSVSHVLVTPGDAVTAGDPLLVLEAMKMEHQVSAPHDGRVTEVRVSSGEQVEPGQVLAVLDDGGT